MGVVIDKSKDVLPLKPHPRKGEQEVRGGDELIIVLGDDDFCLKRILLGQIYGQIRIEIGHGSLADVRVLAVVPVAAQLDTHSIAFVGKAQAQSQQVAPVGQPPGVHPWIVHMPWVASPRQ